MTGVVTKLCNQSPTHNRGRPISVKVIRARFRVPEVMKGDSNKIQFFGIEALFESSQEKSRSLGGSSFESTFCTIKQTQNIAVVAPDNQQGDKESGQKDWLRMIKKQYQ